MYKIIKQIEISFTISNEISSVEVEGQVVSTQQGLYLPAGKHKSAHCRKRARSFETEPEIYDVVEGNKIVKNDQEIVIKLEDLSSSSMPMPPKFVEKPGQQTVAELKIACDALVASLIQKGFTASVDFQEIEVAKELENNATTTNNRSFSPKL